jgi:pyruvate,water dikinase
MKTRYMVELNGIDATDPALAGGKAASLASLSRAGFRVPGGLVVTTDAYRAHVAAIRRFEEDVAALDGADEEALARRAKALRARILTQALPEVVEAELRERLPRLLHEGPVAVRSSATLEDLAGSAFAGIHDSILNVVDLESAWDALRRAWASLWSARAVIYRARAGYEHAGASMAVIVQRFVPAEVSGVAFSLHPITGNLDQVMVNACWGLGETVVRGDGEVDQLVLDKADGHILERRLGTKRRARFPATSGLVDRSLSEDLARRACLDDNRAKLVAKLCREVETEAGFPQDIEWAFAAGELWLLQARPVTHLPARWTRDASAERFPEPMTPLSWDIIGEGFHASLAWSLEWMGLPSLGSRWFELREGYVYGNETAIQLFTRALAPAFEGLDDLEARLPEIQRRHAWVHALPTLWLRDLDRYLIELGRLSQVDPLVLGDRELWQQVEAIRRLGLAYFRPNIALSQAHGLLHDLLARLVEAVAGPERTASMVAELCCAVETRSSQVDAEIHALYELAEGTPELAELLASVDRREIWASGALARFPAFRSRLLTLLADHGHRELFFDLYHPTWSGQPWILLEQVRLMLQQQAAGRRPMPPARREHLLRVRQGQAEARFLALLPDGLRFFASELLRLARLYTSLDDLEHYQTTRLAPPLRQALLALGARMTTRGILSSADEIFFLRARSIEAWLEGTLDQASLAREARAGALAYGEQRLADPPQVWAGEAWSGGVGRSREAAPEHALDLPLQGIPGAPGQAEGPVFLLRGAEDFARLPAGAVLVTRSTSPSWTPLFHGACAIVAESGGPLSHGAITAREMNLPAVMAATGIMRRLREGERVRVNGSLGLIERV